MYKLTTLPNGLRILLVPQAGAKAATVWVLVEAGSKYETKDKNGISHFLEHLAFKGTKKRPSPLAVNTELDRIGGESNAFTSQEYTGYYAKADGVSLDRVLDIISDIYQNSLYDGNEMEKEKGVVIEEMNMYYDTPMRYIVDVWLELLYGDQPAGWPVIGNRETIRGLKREDIVQYVSENYTASKTLVVVSGDVDESWMPKIESYFAGIRVGSRKEKLAVKELQSSPRVKIHFKQTDQTHLVLGFRAFSMHDPRRFALSILSIVLGGGMSSRLFQKVRHEMGAAYYINAGADLSTDHGYFETSCGIDNKRSNEVVAAIMEEYKKVLTEPIPEEEIQKAKDRFRGSLILNTETTDELASFFGSQALLEKEILTPEQLIGKIMKVSAEEVHTVVKDLFRPESLNLAVVGPFKDEQKFLDLLHL